MLIRLMHSTLCTIKLDRENTLFRGGGFYFFCFSNIIYLQVKAQLQHYVSLTSQPNKPQLPGCDIFLLLPAEPPLLEKQKKSNPEPLKKKIFLACIHKALTCSFPG